MALSCSEKIVSIIQRNTSKHDGDVCCLNCLHSYRAENYLKTLKNTIMYAKFMTIFMQKCLKKIIKY